MSALEALKLNLNFAKTLVVSGRERYLGATRVIIQIEQIYRKCRSRSKVLSTADSDYLLKQAHVEAAQLICDLCRQNGAIWVKFAQFLSCRPDILPLEYITALQTLQNDAEPAPFEDIHPIILNNWGDRWDQQFQAFNLVPVATASVAQVHRATLKDGREVAVKFQLPQAQTRFEQDSLVFTTISKAIAPLVKEVDIKQVTAQLLAMTLEELDFNREAANLTRFRDQVHLPGIIMPELISALSHERIMVTSWVDGIQLTDYLTQFPHKAESILSRILISYIQQITQLGVYHADPHPGNFLITENEDIAILDYGAIATLSNQERLNYTHLLMGLMGFSEVKLTELFAGAGFQCARTETLEEISDYIVGDNLQNLSVVERLQDSLDKLRKNKVIIPDSFVAMARVIITIGGFLNQYNVDFEFNPAMVLTVN